MANTTKLNDLQLILLSTAAQREDGGILPLPDSIAGEDARVRKAIPALLRRGLVEEAAVKDAAKTWREEGDRKIGLVITDAGRAPSLPTRVAARRLPPKRTPRRMKPSRRRLPPRARAARPSACWGCSGAPVFHSAPRKWGREKCLVISAEESKMSLSRSRHELKSAQKCATPAIFLL